MKHSAVEELRGRIHHAETELAEELERLLEHNRERFRYTVHAGKVRFEAGVHALHRGYRKGVLDYIRRAPISYLLTAPVIYSLIVPFVLVDVWVTVYQHICFRVYGIARVRRRDYLIFDRGLLGYLNAVEKLNCLYCSYANGVVAYVREVAARTEQYWCPIKHATRPRDTHRREAAFFAYGDAEGYHRDLPKIRAELNE